MVVVTKRILSLETAAKYKEMKFRIWIVIEENRESQDLPPHSLLFMIDRCIRNLHMW